jgi:hypothetical protein
LLKVGIIPHVVRDSVEHEGGRNDAGVDRLNNKWMGGTRNATGLYRYTGD